MNPLTHLLQLMQPSSITPIVPQRFAPRIERLEDRIAPANNVLLSLSGGTLTITTVDQLGEAEVAAGDNNQVFEIIGTAPGEVVVHKSGATTINGVTDVSGVTNIVIDMKLGNDVVTIKALDIAGNLTFKGGDGDNTLTLDANGTNTKLKNLSVTHGDGNDTTSIRNGDAVISGTVTINNGGGYNTVNVGMLANDDVLLLGATSITGGSGTDVVKFTGGHFRADGAVTIKGGHGTNEIRFNNAGSLELNKALAVINGSGFDLFTVGDVLNQSSSFAGITINNGTGGSDIRFDSVGSDSIKGNLIVTSGAGGNHVFIADSNDFAVTGSLKIANGTGPSTTDISPTNSNIVGGAFSLTNGAGKDSTTISATTVNYQAVKISNGNGDSATQLSGTNLSFGGISSASADGLDAFTVNAGNDFAVVAGGLSIKNGAGGSNTSISAAGTAAIQGTLSITSGDGADRQRIGTGAGNFSGLHAIAISNGGGGSFTQFDPAQLTVTGSVSVTSGDGYDEMAINFATLTNFTITGSVKVNTGTGGSVSAVGPFVAGTIAGGLSVTSADGNDIVSVQRIAVNGATQLNLGRGDDNVQIDQSTLAALTISTGSGDDEVFFEHNLFNDIGTILNGALSIDLGSGDDILEFGYDPTEIVTTKATVKLNGGLGLDAFDQNTAINVFAIAAVIAGFEVSDE